MLGHRHFLYFFKSTFSVLSLSFFITSCNTDELIGSKWILSSYHETATGKDIAINQHETYSIAFIDSQTLEGVDGCPPFSCRYDFLDKGHVFISNLIVASQACPDRPKSSFSIIVPIMNATDFHLHRSNLDILFIDKSSGKKGELHFIRE